MFAPEGYVSLSSLWEEFLGKYRTRLSAIARERYRGKTFGQHDEFGSPDDFCEDVFLQLIEKEAIWAVKPLAPAMKLSTQLDGGRSSMFSKLTALESYFVAKDPVEAGPDGYWLNKMGSFHFEAYRDLHRPSLSWRENYPIAEDGLPVDTPLCFHTLPWAFERARFVVPEVMPPWFDDIIDAHFLPFMVRHFGGTALCMDDDAAKHWRDLHVKKSGFLREVDPGNPAHPKIGRPIKQAKVREAYFKLFPEGHPASRENARREIEAYLGEAVSMATLRRAVPRRPERKTSIAEK